jgi:hypothetical protein
MLVFTDMNVAMLYDVAVPRVIWLTAGEATPRCLAVLSGGQPALIIAALMSAQCMMADSFGLLGGGFCRTAFYWSSRLPLRSAQGV